MNMKFVCEVFCDLTVLVCVCVSCVFEESVRFLSQLGVYKASVP